MMPSDYLDVARRVTARVLLTIAVLTVLAAERLDPDVQPPQYHDFTRSTRGDPR